jgi:mannose-6-phosphate isomerase-like protein (cupin superfamily)
MGDPPVKLEYTRLFADADGESHFADARFDLQAVDFAPPAPAVNISDFLAATQCGFLSCPPGWFGDWHPSPRRQFFFFLAGRAEFSASDGEARTLERGDVLLMEDTTGKGHATRVTGTIDLVVAVAQLPAQSP